jgi:MFS family permease
MKALDDVVTESAPSTSPKEKFVAWYMVFVLALVTISTFADRALLSVIIDPIKHDLGVSDFQISLLFGLAFTTLYSVAAIPLGYLADITNRRNLLAAAVFIWSLMTVFCAFSRGYGDLFVGRMGLGLSEAALGPVGFSMIRDVFAPAERGRAFAFVNGQHLVGIGVALLGGGALFGAAAAGRFSGLPVFSHFVAWRLVLVIFGLAGLPLVILLLTVREPARPLRIKTKPGFRETFAHVAKHRLAFTFYWLALGAGGAAQGALVAWVPTAVHRAWGTSIPTIGGLLGPIQMVFIPLASFAAGWTIDRQARKGHVDAPTRVAVVGMGFATALSICQLFNSSLGVATALYIFQMIFFSVFAVVMSSALALLAPTHLAGRLQAFSGLAVSLVGLGSGPSIVALMNGTVFEGSRSLLESVALVFALGSLSCMLGYLGVGHEVRLRRDNGQ